MKQLVILSGKGGTGKTTVAAAFADLARRNAIHAVLADADVDAANLEILLHPNTLAEHEFYGGALAVIDDGLCQGCGNCEQACRFDAIQSIVPANGATYRVDPIACEGCAACFYQCPENAIRMEVQLAGYWFRSESRYGPLFHAHLKPAQENSGKLVTLVKQQARLLASDTGAELTIVDGPPGIGCPVISAVSGADLAVIVAEPTLAGIHDLERILQVTRHFQIATLVCINKYDLFLEGSDRIASHCQSQQVEIAGRIPFDLSVVDALRSGEPITSFRPGARVSQAIDQIWNHTLGRLDLDKQ
jgi:MinD superfamily P-loop ATPase